MKLSEDLLTPEFIEKLKKQDKRFADIDLRLKMEQELRSSPCLRIVLDAAAEEAANALEALADVDPTNTQMVMRLQAYVYRARFIARTINAVILRGELAESSVNEEQSSINLQEE